MYVVGWCLLLYGDVMTKLSVGFGSFLDKVFMRSCSIDWWIFIFWVFYMMNEFYSEVIFHCGGGGVMGTVVLWRFLG
jgi:hypothetical protein